VRTVDTPAFEVRLMSLAPPAQRGAANALHMLAMSVSGLIGPVLGGVVLAAVGAAPLFVLNSLSFLGVIAVLATIRPKLASPEVTGAGEAAEDGRSRIGYASLLRRPDVALYSGVCITSGLINVALVAVLLVRAQDLGLGEGGLGLFLTAASLGALVGGIIAGGIGYEGSRAFAIAALTGALGTIGIVMFGLTNSALAALVVLVLAGIVGAIGEIAGTTAFQNVLPEGVFGRAFSLFLMAGAAGGLIGGIAGPLLSETIGVGASLTLLAIPDLILLVLFGWWAGNLRGRFTLPSLAGPVLEPEVAGHVVVRRPQRAITPIPPRGILSPLLPAPTRFD
jgi:MFS family permease